MPCSPLADLDAVLDYARADRAVLVGRSLGGAIAMEYALTHTGRVSGLVLVSASTSGLPFEPVPELFAAIRAGDPELLEAVAVRLHAGARTDPATDARIRRLIADNLSGLASMGKNWTGSAPVYPRLGGIRAPALVIVGDNDPDFVRIGGLLAGKIPGARLEIVPGADHSVPVRAAAAFTGLLAGFLDSLQR